MKTFVLSVLAIFALINIDLARSAEVSTRTQNKIEHAKTGVFVRVIVDKEVREFEIFIVRENDLREVNQALSSLGFKEKQGATKEAIDALSQRFKDAVNPLKAKGQKIICLEKPATKQ